MQRELSTSGTAWGIHQGNAIALVSSHYPTPMHAFYEYFKNHLDEKANKLFIDVNYKEKKISITGNGKGIDTTEMDRITRDGFKSSKGMKNFGAGIFAFIRFGQRLVFISRKGGKFYQISCAPVGEKYYSDVGSANEMCASDVDEYKEACGRLRSFGEGTAFVIENVGKGASEQFNISFKMEDDFSQKEMEGWLQKNCSEDLRMVNVNLKTGDKASRIKPKLGKGKNILITIPSKPYPYVKNVFKSGEGKFNLTLTFNLWVSASNQGTIRISEDHQNSLDINDAVKTSGKVHHTSLFRKSPLTQFLSGNIDFSINSLGAADEPNVYTGARNCLLLDNEFGDCLSNMLNHAEQIIKPIVQEYEEKARDKQDSRRTLKLNDFFKKVFRQLGDDMSWLKHDDGPAEKRIVKCPICGFSSVPVVMPTKPTKFTLTTKRIIEFTDTRKYLCPDCKNEWVKRGYSIPDEPAKKTETEKEKGEREKHGGKGFSVVVKEFEEHDKRDLEAYYSHPSMVFINNQHPNYKSIREDAGTTKSLFLHEIFLTLSTYMLSTTDTRIPAKEAIEMLRKSYSKMEAYALRKGVEQEAKG